MSSLRSWQTPASLLLLMAFIMPLAFSTWAALINNFSNESAGFTGREIGILQSLREIPGFLAFTAVWLLAFIREQRFALLALFLLAFGVVVTGYFPTVMGLYVTTVIMSIGFHYFETVNQSLTLQWIEKSEAPHFMGRALAVKAAASILVFATTWLLMSYFSISYQTIYLLFGGLALALVLFIWRAFPQYPAKVEQQTRLIVRKSYWLYYTLVFLSGARRQIFMVFAGFLLVEKFDYSAAEISLLFLANYIFNFFFAAKIGKLIGIIGERRALTIEYAGLILVFISYGLVDNGTLAGALYIIDHFFFALAIAIKTYLQKIAKPDDIASTAAVSFTINHVAAVVLPALLGLVWLYSNALVFFIGAGIALGSLIASQFIPDQPEIGAETRLKSSVGSPARPLSGK
ncbi:MFS transporter [Arenicella chitinivorans]|uniref:MFS transporter n=1 Tax=Arenicella chitinivorans TaxID=1329800 RepID=A0A918S1Z4_9GAMM|nr:MFS transporter [Arenicella chitinivorans]GHA19342.1 MFS transporter [Arenicella chitinivorans]